MPPVCETSQGLFKRQRFFNFGVHIGPRKPVIAKFRAAVEIDGSNDTHVALAPLAAAVRHLRLEKFEGIQAEMGIRDLDSLPQDIARLILDEQ
jgi:hypothetical protein